MAEKMRVPTSSMDGGQNEGSQSIARAIEILTTVARFGESGARLSDISSEMELHIATARRIMQALVTGGLLSFEGRSKLYFVGPAALSIAVMGNAWFSRRDDFTPALEAIAARTRDTVMFSIRSGYEAVCLERREGAFPIKVMSLEKGARRPLGVGSGSLAILAFLEEGERAAALRQCAPRFEAFGLDESIVVEGIRDARETGFAFNRGHIIEGVYGVGVPILADGVAIASISVAAIASRMDDERRREIVAIIAQEAAALPDIQVPPGIIDSSSAKGRPKRVPH